jgi:hypothetical protein
MNVCPDAPKEYATGTNTEARPMAASQAHRAPTVDACVEWRALPRQRRGAWGSRSAATYCVTDLLDNEFLAARCAGHV